MYFHKRCTFCVNASNFLNEDNNCFDIDGEAVCERMEIALQ